MRDTKIKFSIVMPCYKEENRLPAYLKELKETLKEIPVELIIVDDGSPIESFNRLRDKISGELSGSIFLHRYERNQGKGFAISHGIHQANGEIVGFLDSDGAIPAYEVKNLLNIYSDNNSFDMLLASRIKMLGKNVDRSFMRHLSGRVFVTFISTLFNIPVYDSQCGFKLFKKNSYESLKNKITDTRWVWDTQLLILFFLNKKKIHEVPIDWSGVADSKVYMLSDSLKMLLKMYNFKKGL